MQIKPAAQQVELEVDARNPRGGELDEELWVYGAQYQWSTEPITVHPEVVAWGAHPFGIKVAMRLVYDFPVSLVSGSPLTVAVYPDEIQFFDPVSRQQGDLVNHSNLFTRIIIEWEYGQGTNTTDLSSPIHHTYSTPATYPIRVRPVFADVAGVGRYLSGNAWVEKPVTVS